jgi:hypothetical protein
MHLKRHSPRRVSALVTLAVLLPTSSAFAQTTTATVRGTVFDDTGALPGAAIVAKETGSGFTHEATSGADGGFTLAGLDRSRPRTPRDEQAAEQEAGEQPGVLGSDPVGHHPQHEPGGHGAGAPQ